MLEYPRCSCPLPEVGFLDCSKLWSTGTSSYCSALEGENWVSVELVQHHQACIPKSRKGAFGISLLLSSVNKYIIIKYMNIIYSK